MIAAGVVDVNYDNNNNGKNLGFREERVMKLR